MSIDLKDRVLVITGGGTGIGASTAMAAAHAGMHVFLCGRRSEPLQRIVDGIRSLGSQAFFMELDVTERDSEIRLLDEAEARLGTPWAIFANAGRGLSRPAHETTPDEMASIFEVNFFATHRLFSEATRRMIEHGRGGHLLACASCLSRFAIPDHAAYAATKASQDMLCQAVRMEVEPHGIHVSSVHPITTTTEFFDTAARHSGVDDLSVMKDTPRAFIQSPDRVADAIVRCLRKPRPEVWTSRIVRYATVIRNLYPKFFDRRTRNMKT
ncbi:MAG: SDR family NAD(P)-dependent oxidoreductase [Phycisphaerales bacterium]|nr:SDR family NAD(P)-dependent oxidoreductase [Phycisphaerales bacterium]